MYGSICIEANKSRISDEIYNKISSVMIMSAGRYTPSDLDQYLNLLETYKIKNIIFIGPYVRSLNSLGDYLSKNETEQLVESNYEFNPLPLFNTINPKSIEFNPSFYEPVTKKHKILFINPLKDFCGENCPLFLEGWPLLVDTHHWSFNFAAQIYNRNYISISDWVSRA